MAKPRLKKSNNQNQQLQIQLQQNQLQNRIQQQRQQDHQQEQPNHLERQPDPPEKNPSIPSLLRKPMLSEDEIVELCAKAQHEITRIYSYALGTPTSEALDLLWGELDDDLQEVARTLVDHILKGERDPAKLHASWVACMRSVGWKWGTSILKKEHAWLMDYEDLPVPQRIRMDLVVSVTVGVASRYGFLV